MVEDFAVTRLALWIQELVREATGEGGGMLGGIGCWDQVRRATGSEV